MFLRDAQFPPRLVYASLLRSQTLLSSDANGTPPAAGARQISRELEKELGSEASAIRRNPAPLLREALELTR